MRKRYSSIDPAKRTWNMMKLVVSSWYQSLHDIIAKEGSKPKIDPIFEVPKEAATPEFFKELLETSAFAKGISRVDEDRKEAEQGEAVTEIKIVEVVEYTEQTEEVVAVEAATIAAVETAEAVEIAEYTEQTEEVVAVETATIVAVATAEVLQIVEETEQTEEVVAVETAMIVTVGTAEALQIAEETEQTEEVVVGAKEVAKTDPSRLFDFSFAEARKKIVALMETGQWAKDVAKTVEEVETIEVIEAEANSEPNGLFNLSFVTEARKKIVRLIDTGKWPQVVETIKEVAEVEEPEEPEIAEPNPLLDLTWAAETREKILTLMESGQWTAAEDITFSCLKEFGTSANEICEAPNTFDEDYIVLFLSLYSKLSYLYAFCLNRRQSHRAPKIALLAPYIQTNPSKELVEACETIARLRYEQKLPVVSLTVAECFQDAIKVALEAGVLPS